MAAADLCDIGDLGSQGGRFRGAKQSFQGTHVESDHYLRLDRDREAAKRGLVVADIEALIAERRFAREAKEWRRADGLRKGLAAQGVILKDTPTATTWTIEGCTVRGTWF